MGSAGNGFVGDDHVVIENNPLVSGESPLMKAFVSSYYTEVLYRPFTVFTFALQWRLHGPRPSLFHLGNVVLHTVATLLLFRTCLGLSGQGNTKSGGLAAFLASLVFATHTIHTDAVSAIVGRAEVLAAIFSLCSVLAWVRWVERGGAFWPLLSGLAYLLGLMSKESAGPLIAFVPFLSLLLKRGLERGRRLSLVTYGASFAIAFIVPLLLYGCLRAFVLREHFLSAGGHYYATVPFKTKVASIFGVFGRYFALLAFPYPLSPDYSWESIPMAKTFFEFWPLFGAVAIFGLLAGTVGLLRSNPWEMKIIGLGLLWFSVFLLPASHLIPLMIPMAERLIYTATLGLSIAHSGLLALLRDRLKKAVIFLSLFYSIMLAGMTIERDKVWRDDFTLWADTVANFPKNALALMNLGGALLEQGRNEAAVAAMERALKVAPWRHDFRGVLGDVLHAFGRHEEEAHLLEEGFRWLGKGPPPDKERICRAFYEVGRAPSKEACLLMLRNMGL